jgi:hypothetical protein
MVGDGPVGASSSVLTLKQCKASTMIFPLGEFGADFACWNPAPAQAEMGSLDNGNAQPRIDVSACL